MSLLKVMLDVALEAKELTLRRNELDDRLSAELRLRDPTGRLCTCFHTHYETPRISVTKTDFRQDVLRLEVLEKDLRVLERHNWTQEQVDDYLVMLKEVLES